MPLEVMDYIASNPLVKTHQLSVDALGTVASSSDASALRSESIEPFYGWQRPKDFVQDLWPHAQRASNVLGVSAEVLVAQSALETGWGRHAMRNADGSIAFNLFGIKAGSDWNGQRVVQSTLEFRDGAMQREQAVFRAYESVGDAVDDYVEFVQSRPHYAEALAHQGSDANYVKGLQDGGYATDPRYAEKILRIMRGDTLGDVLARLTPSSRLLS
jgi:flagellar protein FlgJ